MKLNEVHKQRIGLAAKSANAGHVVVISVEHGESPDSAKLGWVEYRPGMRAQNHVIASGSLAQMHALVNQASDEFERQKRAAIESGEPIKELQESGVTTGA